MRRGRSVFPFWSPARVRRFIPSVLGVTSLAVLLLAVDPVGIGHAMARFPVGLVPVVVLLSVATYVLQGLQWQPLLRELGARLRTRDTVLLNVAGQATSLLPLGELTRAVLLANAAEISLGGVVATITVQELVYTLVLMVAALPGIVEFPQAAPAVLLALGGIVGILAVLTVAPVSRGVLRLVERTPGLRRVRRQVEELQQATVILLHRPRTYAWSALALARAGASIAALWLVLDGLAPGVVGWREAAVVFAISNIVGAISLIPGGIGAYEASMLGLLVVAGLDPGIAAAAALVHRLADKGPATLLGFAAFGLARRRYSLRGLDALFGVATRRVNRPAPAVASPAVPDSLLVSPTPVSP
jgi:uncharacterized protein (TIRG00374 family)